MSSSVLQDRQQEVRVTGAHVFAAALKRHGVKVIFGQSIPSALFLAAPAYGIRQIGYRTENAGAAMADAYARVSHKVGVVTAQNGPAATLLVPGLAEAFKASVPVVAIVQDVATNWTDKNAFQELDHLDLFRGCTKWIRRVGDVNRIDDYIDMAFTAAASGRPGPCVLMVPMDFFVREPKKMAGARRASLGYYPLDRVAADPAAVRAAADLLASAKRPLIIAGGGVHLSDAALELARLQQDASLPVATTVMGKGTVDERHPLSVGVVGYFMGTGGMARDLRALVTDADVVMLVGNRTNQNGTDSWSLYPPSAKYIHIDVDGLEVGRNYEAVRVVGDAKLTLAALRDELATRDLSQRKAARPKLEQTIAAGRASSLKAAEKFTHSQARPIRPERLMHDLDTIVDEDTLVVCDASYASIWAANFLTARTPGQRIITPRGLAGLGWGLPMAIGAKVARPESKVFCLSGDGGFGHVWSELETARRMGLPIVLTVLNNQILGYQKHYEKVAFNDYSDACDFTPVDHAAIARACGWDGIRIENPDDFLPAVKKAFAEKRMTLLDIVTDEHAYPPITSFEANSALAYLDYNHPSDIMEEIASLVPIYGGISYERIEDQGIQWPCPTKDHPGTTTLYTDLFARPGGLAKFMALDHIGSGETTDEKYPFVLITGRIREHYNNGSMTGRVPGIMALVPEELLELSAQDAETLRITSGEMVRVASRRGEVIVKAKVTKRSQPGNVFLTFHFRNALTNILTSEHRDPITGTPEYKSCAVRIEKFLEEQAPVSRIDYEIRDSRIHKL